MRAAKKKNDMPQELILAIGLVWGHLNVGQYDQAYQLARGCLRVWPANEQLNAMAAFAAVELGEPLDEQAHSSLTKTECKEWVDIVLRRASAAANTPPLTH